MIVMGGLVKSLQILLFDLNCFAGNFIFTLCVLLPTQLIQGFE